MNNDFPEPAVRLLPHEQDPSLLGFRFPPPPKVPAAAAAHALGEFCACTACRASFDALVLQVRDLLTCGTDGPVTDYVIIRRAVEAAKDFPDFVIAEALYNEMKDRGHALESGI